MPKANTPAEPRPHTRISPYTGRPVPNIPQPAPTIMGGGGGAGLGMVAILGAAVIFAHLAAPKPAPAPAKTRVEVTVQKPVCKNVPAGLRNSQPAIAQLCAN